MKVKIKVTADHKRGEWHIDLFDGDLHSGSWHPLTMAKEAAIEAAKAAFLNTDKLLREMYPRW